MEVERDEVKKGKNEGKKIIILIIGMQRANKNNRERKKWTEKNRIQRINDEREEEKKVR